MGPARKASDFPKPKCDVWAEAWEPLQLFIRNMTQWNAGGMGIVGFKYEVFHRHFDKNGFTQDQEYEWTNMLRIIEDQARKHLNQ